MRIPRVTNSTAIHGTGQLEAPVSRHEMTERLLLNRLAARFFERATSTGKAMLDIFDGIMKNGPLMKLLSPAMNRVDDLGRDEIVRQARAVVNEYVQETAFAISAGLVGSDRLVENFLALTPNGELDLGQFLNANLSALQMISDPAKYELYKSAIVPRFEKVYLVLRAGEILSSGSVIPIAAAPFQPSQVTAKLERGSIDVINGNIAIQKLDEQWRDLLKAIILAPHPLPAKIGLETAIEQFRQMSPEEVSTEAKKYDHAIHQSGEADLPHPHDAKELEERGLNWAEAVLIAYRTDSRNVKPSDLVAAFRTALVWLSSKYHPARFAVPKQDFLPPEIPAWQKK